MNAQAELERYAKENHKLQKINSVLMARVERSMNQESSDFALFERAILLEGEVRARTLALESALSELQCSHAALAAAKTEAERANLSKTRFLAAASHDLLQPLSAARLFVAALAETKQTRANRAMLDKIADAFATVEAMLSALLEISRLDSGALAIQPVDLDVDQLFRQLTLEFAPFAASKGLRLRHRSASAVVHTDPQLIGRVLRNLLSNAIRYTDRGGVLLGARPRGDHWRIDVVDSGIGIPPHQQTEVFEEFHRLHRGSEGSRGGFGLGLAIVQRIVRLLGHPIEVRSILGRGSSFSLHLPRGAPKVRGASPAAAAQSRGWKQQFGAVLLIENDAAVRDGMSALLSAWGYEVVTAAGGGSAVEALRAAGREPDVIVADYHLDDGQVGPAAIRHVREALGRDLPAFVITADHSGSLLEDLARQGLLTLTKPIKLAPLRSTLRQLIVGSERRQDVPI